jgi:hypothetical protein
MAAGKGEVRIGDRVNHSKLGVGDVLDVHPLGEETCAVISFEQWGQKKIILRYATLEILPELEEEVEEGIEGGGKKDTKKKVTKAKKTAKAKKTTKTKKTTKGKKS